MWRRAAACAVRPFHSRLVAGRMRRPSTSAAIPYLARAASSSDPTPTVAEAAAADSVEAGSISAAVEAGSVSGSSKRKAGDFIAELEEDMEDCVSDLSVDRLKKLYDERVFPALELRCLVSPYSLTGDDAARLHHSYKAVIGSHPRYYTSLDLMVDLETKYEGRWGPFLDHLSEKRFLIIKDWSKPLLTASSSTRYDYGLILPSEVGDERKLYKGEADASVKGEVASLAYLILDGNQVFTSQVYHDVPCEKGDSNQAEALAMYLLLKRCLALGLHLHNVIICTDNQTVHEILTGARKITEDDKHWKLYMLLRHMRSQYPNLICIKEPREKLQFVDQLLREPFANHDTEKMNIFIPRALQDWAPKLRGAPIFVVSDHKDSRTSILANQEMYIDDFHQRCYLEVDEDKKVDALWHISFALRVPLKVYVAIKDLDKRPNIRKGIEELFPVVDDCLAKSVGIPLLKFYLPGLPRSKAPAQDLLILYDATAEVDLPSSWNPFVVYLSTPDQCSMMEAESITKYSPLSFISYHAAMIDKAKQELKEKKRLDKAKEPERQRFKRRLKKAKEDDKKTLCNICEALCLLESSPSVSEEIQVLLSSAIKEVEMCNSTLERGCMEGGKQAKRASAIAAHDKLLIALIHKANDTLKRMKKEIDNELIQLGNRQPPLNRNHSKVTGAVAYIKETIEKGGIKEIIRCHEERKDW